MYTKVLKNTFKYEKFREKQLTIVKKVIEDKKDVCCIMYTGMGKSLCFQYVPVFLKKTAIIVSPLIALMNDQKQKLDALGIPACCLNSTVNKDILIDKIINNEYRIVYVTPEYIVKCEYFLRELQELEILCLVAIDEAHTISNWGVDFRPEYRDLGILKTWVPGIPIMALTATATPQVQADIINILQLDDPYVVKTTFDRPNLYIKIASKTTIVDDILDHVISGDPTIIYAKTHKDTEKISDTLTKHKVKCGAYHAGLSIKVRTDIHNKFIKNELTCVVATIAFGMGIDIPIRNVIHYCVSSDIESYYQEIGRAGRDNKPSKCITYFGSGDLHINNFFINQIEDPIIKKQKNLLYDNMKQYIYSSICRKKYILNYFGEKFEACGDCDICEKKLLSIQDNDNDDNDDNNIIDTESLNYHDFTVEAFLILFTIKITKSCYGGSSIINILTGKIKATDKNSYLMNLTTFKKCDKNKKWLSGLIQLLVNDGYILEKMIPGNKFGKSLAISKKGLDWINTINNTNIHNEVAFAKSLATINRLTIHVPDILLQNFIIIDKKKVIQKDTNLLKPKVKIIQKDTNLIKPKAKIIQKDQPVDKCAETYLLFKQGKTISEIAKKTASSSLYVEKRLVKLYIDGKDITFDELGITETMVKDVKKNMKLDYKQIKENTKLKFVQIKCIIHFMQNS